MLVENDIQFVEDSTGAFLATIRIVKPPKDDKAAGPMHTYQETQSRLMKQTFSSQQKAVTVEEEPTKRLRSVRDRQTTPIKRTREKSPASPRFEASKVSELSDIIEEQTKLNTVPSTQKRNGGGAIDPARVGSPVGAKPLDEALTKLVESSRLAKLIELLDLKSAKGVRPKLLPIPNLMHLVEEIYSAKYQQDTTMLETKIPFPAFVAQWFQSKYVQRKAVIRWSVDFINSLEAFCRSYTEVQVFTKFLTEQYDRDDLVFFLFLRANLEKELKIHFTPVHAGDKTVKDTRNLFLTFKQCAKVTKSVFGPNEETLQQAFLVNIEKAMPAGKGQPVLSASKFMESLLADYHASRPGDHESSVSPFDIDRQTPDPLHLDSVSDAHYVDPRISSEPDSHEFLQGLEGMEPRRVNLSSRDSSRPLSSASQGKEAIRDMCLRYSAQQLVPQYIEAVVADLQEVSDEAKATISGQIIEILVAAMNDLLVALFRGDKLLWLRLLDLEARDTEALRHVEGLQRKVLQLQKRGAQNVTGEDIEDLCGSVLGTQELRMTVGKLLSSLTAQFV